MPKTGKLEVRFYDAPERVEQPATASVVYSYSTGDPLSHFVRYFQKITYCLGPDSSSTPMLREVLGTAANSGLANVNLLVGSNYTLQLRQPSESYRKVFSSTFLSSGIVRLKTPLGGEDYYATMSVIAFLQHLIDTLPTDVLPILEVAILGALDGKA